LSLSNNKLVRHHSNLTSNISAIVAGIASNGAVARIQNAAKNAATGDSTIASNSAIAYYSSTIRVINATSKGRR
jgi:hypothetical protein